MASTYTTNLGIEKIGTGEQSGTWGDTTNTNFDILDEAINGIISVTLSSAGSSGSPTALPITDGASSNGRNKFIEFVDGGDLGGTAYVQLTPNNAEKVVHIRNSLSSSRSVIVFQGTYNASNDFEIVNGADVLLKFNGGGSGATVTDVNVDLTVTGATIATADINGGTIDGAVIGGASAAAGTFTTITGTTITASTAAVPDASDGATLGSASLEWSDLYLADGAVVYFGDDQDITLTHVADTGLTLKHANTGDDKFPTFLLATGDTDIAASDKLGVINFQAPDEGAGTDAILVAAGIEAVSEGNFSSSSNATSLVFKTASSEAAAEKMRINSSGNVGVGATTVNRKLELAGNNNAGAKANYLRITDTDTSATAANHQGGIEFYASDSSGGAGVTASMEVVYAGSGGGGEITFNTAANSGAGVAEAMRIDESGNLLVGKTSSGLTTAGSQITGASILQSVSSTSTNLATNNGAAINLCNTSATDGNFSNIGGYNSNGLVVSQINFINPSHSSRTGAITFTTHSGSAFSEAMRIDSSANVNIGSASNHAGARVVINDTPPTAFGSPMFQVGQETFTGSGMYSIGLGYTAGSYTEPPVEIAALTTSDSGGTKADIVFGTRSVTTNTAVTERMRIDSSGQVIILGNNGSPTNSLDLSYNGSTGEAKIQADSNGGSTFLTFGTSASGTVAESMRIDSSGNLLVGCTSFGSVSTEGCQLGNGGTAIFSNDSDVPLYLNRTTSGVTTSQVVVSFFRNDVQSGTIGVSQGGTPAFGAPSDIRLKNNVTDHKSELTNVMALRPVSWDWKDSSKGAGEGFVAQELEQTAWADLVSEGEDGYKMVSGLGAVETRLIKALQEAVTRIETLEAEVAALKGA